MRRRTIVLLLISWGLLGSGVGATAYAASDVEQSKYEIKLTPATHPTKTTTQTGAEGALISGNHQSNHRDTPTNQSGAQAVTAQKAAFTGRLPQLSEQQWYGFGSLLGVILLLLYWVWKLTRKRRS